MLLNDKNKKKKKNRYFRQSPKSKSQPTRTPSNVTQETPQVQPQVETSPAVDVRDNQQPMNFFSQLTQPSQQPVMTQQTPSQTQPMSLPPSGMQSLVTQGYDPNMLMQSIINSPTLAKIKENDDKIARLKETPVQDKDGFWWSLAKAGMSGLAEAFNPANPIRNEGDFYNRVGYAAGKAAGGGVNRKWNEVRDIQTEIAKTYQENELLTDRAKQEFDMQQKAAQFATTTQKVGDQLLLQQSKEQNDRAEFDRRQQLNEDKFVQAKKDSFFRRYRAFDPLLASESQIRELKEFGETPESVGKYNFTNPKEKTVNGVSYLYNPLTQSFDESGLPNDPNKTIVEYAVEDSVTGVKYKFAVSSENAARFRTSIENARMQIKAASERQQSQQTFQGNENEKNRKQRWDMFKQSYRRQIEDSAKRNAFNKVAEMQKLNKSLAEREIEPDQYAEIKAIIDSIQ